MKKFRKREGRCYEVAWKYLINDERFTGWQLVHGEGRGPNGARIGHAWLEHEAEVFDPVLDEFLSAKEYRKRYAAIGLQRYSRVDAARAGSDAKHFGPWP